MKKLKSQQDAMRRAVVAEIADILAAGVLRRHLRDVRSLLKKTGKSEIDLEVSSAKSLHRLEPAQRGRRR
ncbi:MAG TPA: hypothetical protein PKW95_23965 [bacterium]|nr:hypothetical protein [bacterium]